MIPAMQYTFLVAIEKLIDLTTINDNDHDLTIILLKSDFKCAYWLYSMFVARLNWTGHQEIPESAEDHFLFHALGKAHSR